MRAASRMNPGAKGTLRYVEQYGDRLVCVRYRYDRESRRRCTTVELIVGELDMGRFPAVRAWTERVAAQPGHVPITDEVGESMPWKRGEWGSIRGG